VKALENAFITGAALFHQGESDPTFERNTGFVSEVLSLPPLQKILHP